MRWVDKRKHLVPAFVAGGSMRTPEGPRADWRRCGRASEAYSLADAVDSTSFAAGDGVGRGPLRRTREGRRAHQTPKPVCREAFGPRNGVRGVRSFVATSRS